MKDISGVKILETAARSSLPILVDIYTPQCGLCRVFSPVLEELADEYFGKADFVKFDGTADEASIYAGEKSPFRCGRRPVFFDCSICVLRPIFLP